MTERPSLAEIEKTSHIELSAARALHAKLFRSPSYPPRAGDVAASLALRCVLRETMPGRADKGDVGVDGSKGCALRSLRRPSPRRLYVSSLFVGPQACPTRLGQQPETIRPKKEYRFSSQSLNRTKCEIMTYLKKFSFVKIGYEIFQQSLLSG